jgi:hypothetical protein
MQPAAFHARPGGNAGLRKTVRDILQDRRVLGEHKPFIGAQRRHQSERVHLIKIRTVILHDLGLGIDLKISGLGAGLIQRNAGRQRAGQRREIQVHEFLLGGLAQFTEPVDFNRRHRLATVNVNRRYHLRLARGESGRAAFASSDRPLDSDIVASYLTYRLFNR